MSEEIDYKSAYESVLILKDMLIKENQQLKEELELYENGVIYDSRVDKLESVLDEIREYIDRKRRNFIFSYGVGNEFIREYDDLLEILDKVKE